MLGNIWSNAGPPGHLNLPSFINEVKTQIVRQKMRRLMVARAGWGTCLEAVVQHVRRGSNGKHHEKEDEETSLPVVGTDMLCGVQDSPHEPP